jgi:hypothetical protein
MNKIVFTREVDGRLERVEWNRKGDDIWMLADGVESLMDRATWQQTWADLEARGFIEAFPADRRKLNLQKARVLELVRSAFQGVRRGWSSTGRRPGLLR